MEQKETIQREISIKELIMTVWKGKVLIAILTASAIFAGVILSFFILTAQYESTVSLRITPFTVKISGIDASIVLIDHLAAIRAMTKADYLAQVKSVEILEDTIKRLDLKDNEGNPLSQADLASMITVSDVTGTEHIVIRVINRDSKQATRIAETLSSVFAEYVAERSAEKFQEASTSVSQQLSEQETVLEAKRTAMNDFLTDNPNLAVLQLAVKNMTNQIGSYELSVAETELQISYDAATLEALRSVYESEDILSIEDYDILIDTNVYTNSLGHNIISVSPDELQESLIVIDMYTVQSRLINNYARVEAMNIAIPEIESQLTETQLLLAEQQNQYDEIAAELDLAQRTLNVLKQRDREAQSYASSNIGDSVVSILSAATVPGSPVSPNRKLIIGGAGMAAFCFGVCIVLYRKYWMEPTDRKPAKKKA